MPKLGKVRPNSSNPKIQRNRIDSTKNAAFDFGFTDFPCARSVLLTYA